MTDLFCSDRKDQYPLGKNVELKKRIQAEREKGNEQNTISKKTKMQMIMRNFFANLVLKQMPKALQEKIMFMRKEEER